MRARSGSALIYCIALSAVLVIIGYGFLRGTMKDMQAGDATTKNLLARTAARMGMVHAMETIVADYARTTIVVGQGSAGTTTVPSLTFLDGPYRAEFVSLRSPNRLYKTENNRPNDDDLSAAVQSTYGYLPWAGGSEGGNRHSWHSQAGVMIFDGRGRFIESDYHNTTRPSPAGISEPIAPVRFFSFAEPVPERSGGLFLDRSFHRVDTGSVSDDRLAARFRLRYAVGVEDLGGHLLVNPLPEGDFSWKNPAADYRNPPAWVLGAKEGWYNLVGALGGNGTTTVLRWGHVFLGRGLTSNADRDPGTGTPITYPMMFRRHLAPTDFWGYFALQEERDSPRKETDGLYAGASITGGEQLSEGTGSNQPIIHALSGPSHSWFNEAGAVKGWLGDGDGDYGGGQAPGDSEVGFQVTPFGRRLTKAAGAPGTWKWYEGRTDCPWYVNLLTATPRTIHCMAIGYLPPKVKVMKLTQEWFYEYLGLDARGNDKWSGAPMNATAGTISPPIDVAIRGHDVFTRLSGPAFDVYAPPSADGISPNFQQPDTRPPEAVYPGRIWNNDDSLGKEIDLNTQFDHARCSHTSLPLIFNFSAERSGTFLGGGFSTVPPVGWGRNDKDKYVQKLDPDVFKFVDSYWWDLLTSFSTTIATVKAQWVQYPTKSFDPITKFVPSGFRDPSAFATMEEVDRLFLRQLGENFDTPGDGIALDGVACTWGSSGSDQVYTDKGFAISNTIKMLVDAAKITPQQANVMERVLNDFRMSFFGAGPQYSEIYRPMDFSGDGRVHTSCYSKNPSATPTEEEDGLAWWRPVVASGRGPEPEYWFSLTGCFYLGKSHYYRIFSQGEIFDNVINKPATDATLESVICVDPEGNNPKETQVLFQRWHYSRETGHLPRQMD